MCAMSTRVLQFIGRVTRVSCGCHAHVGGAAGRSWGSRYWSGRSLGQCTPKAYGRGKFFGGCVIYARIPKTNCPSFDDGLIEYPLFSIRIRITWGQLPPCRPSPFPGTMININFTLVRKSIRTELLKPKVLFPIEISSKISKIRYIK